LVATQIDDKILIGDIRDAEGFVAATIKRSGLRLESAEREELLAEGLCILLELGEHYEPLRNGYATGGSFSGYAAQFLPRRLGDAWHKSNSGHRRVMVAEGRRAWMYEPAPVSMDAEDFLATPLATSMVLNFEDPSKVEKAMRRLEPWAQVAIRPMVELLDQGYGRDEIGQRLNISREQLRTMDAQLMAAVADVEREEGRERQAA
jgi:hypothetical protein